MTNTVNTPDMRAALTEARDWFESQAKAVSKGCGSSYELHDLRMQRDALDAALAAPAPAQAGEYPPLPYPGGNIEQGGGWVAPTPFFTADQMRAFADATCAARGAAQAAPVDAAKDASARFKAQHEFLLWNREQNPSPIESATEYSVFNQAVDFYLAAHAARAAQGDGHE